MWLKPCSKPNIYISCLFALKIIQSPTCKNIHHFNLSPITIYVLKLYQTIYLNRIQCSIFSNQPWLCIRRSIVLFFYEISWKKIFFVLCIFIFPFNKFYRIRYFHYCFLRYLIIQVYLFEPLNRCLIYNLLDNIYSQYLRIRKNFQDYLSNL